MLEVEASSQSIAKNPWREAITDSCVVAGIPWDEQDSHGSLSSLIHWENQIALDPSVSSEAAALVDRGLQFAINVILSGYFLHDESPTKKWANEVVQAIKREVQKAADIGASMENVDCGNCTKLLGCRLKCEKGGTVFDRRRSPPALDTFSTAQLAQELASRLGAA